MPQSKADDAGRSAPTRMSRRTAGDLQPEFLFEFTQIIRTAHGSAAVVDRAFDVLQPVAGDDRYDCRGTVVISQDAFQRFLATLGNKVEYIHANA